MSHKKKKFGDSQALINKIYDGFDIFDDLIPKLDSPSQEQRIRFEDQFKHQIKRLQKFRDLLKPFINNADPQDKSSLLDVRTRIELYMEQYRIIEKIIKQRPGSRGTASFTSHTKISQLKNWIDSCLDTLQEEIDEYRIRLQKMNKRRRTKYLEELEHLEAKIASHNFHIDNLNNILKLMYTGDLDPNLVSEIQDDVDYYVSDHADPEYHGEHIVYELIFARQQNLQNQNSQSESVLTPEIETITASSSSNPNTTSSTRIPLQSIFSQNKPVNSTLSAASSSSSSSASTKSLLGTPLIAPPPISDPSPAKKSISTIDSDPFFSAMRQQGTKPRPSQPFLPLQPSETTIPGPQWGTPASGRSLDIPTPPNSKTTLLGAWGRSLPTNPSGSALLSGTNSTGSSSSFSSAPSNPDEQLKRDPDFPTDYHLEQVAKDLDVAFSTLSTTQPTRAGLTYTYNPVNPAPPQSLPASYPKTPQPIFFDSYVYSKMSLDPLFYIVVYMPGTYQQYCASRELEHRRWKFDKATCTWINIINGKRVMFEYGNNWGIKEL